VVTLAVHHPHLAAGIAAVLLIVGLVIVSLLARLIRRGWRRWKGKEGVEPQFRWRRARSS
jgi:DMSO/TMAO reductase YedYZ heme-binding membrane subunit